MRSRWIGQRERGFLSSLLISVARLVVLVIPFVFPQPVLAQIPPPDVSFSFFTGAAIPFKTDLRETAPSIAADVTARDVKLDTSASYGGKVSLWATGSRPRTGFDLGAELDITHFSPNVGRQTVTFTGTLSGVTDVEIDVDATIVAFNFLLRWPIGVTGGFPHGQWYPYWGIGAGVEVADATTRETLLTIGRAQNQNAAGVFQVLGGLKVFFSRSIALFGEYKFTRAEHTFDFPLSRVELTNGINHLVGGVAVHF